MTTGPLILIIREILNSHPLILITITSGDKSDREFGYALLATYLEVHLRGITPPPASSVPASTN